MKKGELIVISGFSGVGKGTVIGALRSANPEYRFSVSATTRAPRPGEMDGREYFFISREAFEKRISEGDLLEYTCYNGNYYGTPLSFIEEQRAKGFHILLDIETEGALNVKRLVPDATLIFMIPPDAETLRRRLTGRGTETREQIIGRMKKSLAEAELVPRYDWIVVNEDFRRCAWDIYRIATGSGRPMTERAEALRMTEQFRRDLPAIIESL